MSSKVKELLDNKVGFWSSIMDFCKDYGQTIYAHGVRHVALSDAIQDPHTQPTVTCEGKGACLPTYTLQQAGDCWDIINKKGQVWTLESWECFENPDLPKGFDETLASEIKALSKLERSLAKLSFKSKSKWMLLNVLL